MEFYFKHVTKTENSVSQLRFGKVVIQMVLVIKKKIDQNQLIRLAQIRRMDRGY